MIRRRKGSTSKRPEEPTKDKHSPTSSSPQPRSEIAELWLRSRETETNDVGGSTWVTGTQQYRKPLIQRPFNKTTLKIALRLARLETRPVWSMLLRTDSKLLKRYLLTQILVSLAPAAKVQAMASLLNLVQSSLSGLNEPISYTGIAVHATFALVTGSLGRVLPMINGADVAEIKRTLDQSIQIEYIRRKLSMDIPTAVDPYVAALAKEAGVFSGFAMMEFTSPDGSLEGFFHQGLFDFLQDTVFAVLVSIIEFVSVSALLMIVCLDVARNPELGMLAVVVWIALILVLAFLPIIYGVISATLENARSSAEEQQSSRIDAPWIKTADLRRIVQDVQNREEIVLFGLADWIAKRWHELCQEVDGYHVRERESRWKDVMQESFQDSGQVIFYSMVALRCLPTGLTLGSIKTFQGTAEQLSHTIRQLRRKLFSSFQAVFIIAAWLALKDTCAIVESNGREAVIETVQDPSDPREKGSSLDADRLDYEAHRGTNGMKIEAKGLCFRYPGKSGNVLRNINLVIEPGESLAIVGYNGSGKTTLLKVLIGLYDHGGQLLVNDIPSQLYKRGQLHHRTTACFQEYSKYVTSLRSNISLGRLAQDDEGDAKILAALSRAEGQSIVNKIGLDANLDPWSVGSDVENSGATELGSRMAENGFQALSLGQWQKISLARGFLTSDHADLVVFDEPSASLDPQAEKTLFNKIRSLSDSSADGGTRATTIYISHRFSTVRHADKIAVVEDGTVIEHGSHDDLIKRNGRYRELFEISREGYVD